MSVWMREESDLPGIAMSRLRGHRHARDGRRGVKVCADRGMIHNVIVAVMIYLWTSYVAARCRRTELCGV